jgi:TolA-binding protein
MNARQVLDRIVKTLSLSKEEVLFTYAKLADGTILESPTFDLGETVDVVSEDGTKTPAPNGEHEVVLKDSEGNDVRIKVQTEDGKIVERENVEVETPAEDEAVAMESIAGGDMGDDEEVDTEETANPIPEDMGAVVTKLQYRIEELEKKMQSMETIKEGGKAEKVKTEDLPGDPTKVNTVDKLAAVEPDEDEEEEELPKLDGAPIDENAQKQNGVKFNKKGSLVNPQNSFLSKLYK